MPWCGPRKDKKKKKRWLRSSCRGSAVMNPTSICEDAGLIPSPAQWVKDPSGAMSCGVGHRLGSDPVLLWLWCRPAAPAPIQPLAWELSYAAGAALKRQKKNQVVSRFHCSHPPRYHHHSLPPFLLEYQGLINRKTAGFVSSTFICYFHSFIPATQIGEDSRKPHLKWPVPAGSVMVPMTPEHHRASRRHPLWAGSATLRPKGLVRKAASHSSLAFRALRTVAFTVFFLLE